jgi:hypothetical protein
MNHDCNVQWDANKMVLQFSNSRASHLLLHKQTSYCSINLGNHGVNGAQSSYYNWNGFVTTDYTKFNNDLITKLSAINWISMYALKDWN